MKYSLLIVLLCFSAMGQSGLDVPQAGWMVDHSGALRNVTGIAHSFVVGDALRTDVLSAACAVSWCLVKTGTSLIARQDSENVAMAAPDGPAIFSMHGSIHERSALVYFPLVKQFAHFEASELRMLDWQVDGEVLALSSTREGPRFAVRRGDGVWVIGLDGRIESGLPAGTVAVLLLEGATLYSLADSVVLRRQDANEIVFNVPGAIALSQLGENYVQVTTAGSTYALRVDREQLSLLPDLGSGGPSQ